MSDNRNPITYFPVATQRQFDRNREQVRGTPYEHYFDGDLWLHDDVMPAIRTAMDPAHAIHPVEQGLNSLLDPGHHEIENGYCALPDGGAYVASRVPFPGCTGEMFRWWFWWHAVEPARYTLWYPHNHISASPTDRSVLRAPGLTDEERYVGTTHHVEEYIGDQRLELAISFVDPAELGFDTDRFRDAGIVGHACARVALRRTRLEAVTMVHLARETDDGFELRSRYWFGHDPRLRVGDRSLTLAPLARRFGGRRTRGLAGMAYEQLLHDQIEFTHLSTFLADIHGEFGGPP